MFPGWWKKSRSETNVCSHTHLIWEWVRCHHTSFTFLLTGGKPASILTIMIVIIIIIDNLPNAQIQIITKVLQVYNYVYSVQKETSTLCKDVQADFHVSLQHSSLRIFPKDFVHLVCPESTLKPLRGSEVESLRQSSLDGPTNVESVTQLTFLVMCALINHRPDTEGWQPSQQFVAGFLYLCCQTQQIVSHWFIVSWWRPCGAAAVVTRLLSLIFENILFNYLFKKDGGCTQQHRLEIFNPLWFSSEMNSLIVMPTRSFQNV